MATSIKPQNMLHTFDPRLRQILEAGTQGKVIINGRTDVPRDVEIGRLTHMSQRLNLMRKQLLEVDDPAAKQLYRAKVTLDRGNLRLIIEPRDSNLNDLLDQFEKGPALAPTMVLGDAAAELDDLAAAVLPDDGAKS